MLRYWPVPESYRRSLPGNGDSGVFWEDRGDRRHCGTDIYAPEGSRVLATEAGEIVDVDMFTSPEKVSYWHTTYHIIIRHNSGLITKYAELKRVEVKVSDQVKAGQVIGYVGSVLNMDKISGNSPLYIRRLKENNYLSMLHFELYSDIPVATPDYLGGNVFGPSKPDHLMDPTDYLKSAVKE